MKIKVSSDSLNDLCEEGLALGLFSDEKPPRGVCGIVDWHLNGLISRSIARRNITGSLMEKVLIHPHDNLVPSKILLVGLKSVETLTYEELYQVGGVVITTLENIHCRNLATQVPGTGRCSLSVSHMAFAFVSGLLDALKSMTANSHYDSHIIHILAEVPYMDDIITGIRQCPAIIEDRIPVDLGEAQSCTPRALSQ